MSEEWILGAFPKTSSMVNWHGTRKTGRPELRCRDVLKRDMAQCGGIAIDSCKRQVDDRSAWQHAMKLGTKEAKEDRHMSKTQNRMRHKEQKQQC